jgi:hypothetical protein
MKVSDIVLNCSFGLCPLPKYYKITVSEAEFCFRHQVEKNRKGPYVGPTGLVQVSD